MKRMIEKRYKKSKVITLLYVLVFTISTFVPASATSRLEDDFFDFVNHKAVERYRASGEQSTNYMSVLSKFSARSTAQIIRQCVENAGTYERGSAQQRIGDMFRCAMDLDTRNQVGWAPLQEIIDGLKTAETIEEYMDLAPLYMESGEGTLLTFWTEADVEDTTKMIVQIPTCDYFLSRSFYMDESRQGLIEAYERYATHLFESAGYDQAQAQTSADNVLKIAREGALLDLAIEEKTQVANTNNIYTLAELQELYSNVDIISLLAKLGFGENDRYKVESVENARYVNTLLTAEHLREICDYTLFVILNDYVSYGPIDCRDAYMDFVNLLNNTAVRPDDYNQALKIVEKTFRWEIGDEYAKNYFDPDTRNEIEEMIRAIQQKYMDLTDRQDWLSQECKDMIHKKMEMMIFRIGAPEDPSPMELEFEVASPEEGGNLLQIVLNYYRADYKQRMQEYRDSFIQGRDETKWVIYPTQVQAYYKYYDNSINISASILKGPYYTRIQPEVEILAGIGEIIAHEISHAFDSSGRQYDENGDYRIWWSEAEDAVYQQKAMAVVEQYDAIVCDTGKHVNGSLTLPENIADLAAVTVMAEYVKDKGLSLQDFFIAYARNNLEYLTDEYLNLMLDTDQHSPNKIRCNNVLSNTDLFYEAFDIKETDGMYIAPENRVGIWR